MTFSYGTWIKQTHVTFPRYKAHGSIVSYIITEGSMNTILNFTGDETFPRCIVH
jgi:hypothetical protein